MSDYGPEFDRFAERARNELVPKIKDTNLFVSITSTSKEKVDIKFALELGLAIMFNKPIVAVIQPGTEISAKFSKVVDRFVELDFNDPTSKNRVADALKEIMEEENGLCSQK